MLVGLARALGGPLGTAAAASGALRAGAAGLLLTQHAGSFRGPWEQPCRRLASVAPADPSLIRNFAIIGAAVVWGVAGAVGPRVGRRHACAAAAAAAPACRCRLPPLPPARASGAPLACLQPMWITGRPR